jgi:hypothetical protein
MASVDGILDANILFDAAVRDLILQVASTGLLQVRWSERIEDEARRSLIAAGRLQQVQWPRLRDKMRAATVEPLVEGFEHLEQTLELPDPDDRHVLAAAIQAGIPHIVTNNGRDFPAAATDPFGIVAITPDMLLIAALAADRALVLKAAQDVRQRLRDPPMSFAEYVDTLTRRGLVTTAAALSNLNRSAPLPSP